MIASKSDGKATPYLEYALANAIGPLLAPKMKLLLGTCWILNVAPPSVAIWNTPTRIGRASTPPNDGMNAAKAAKAAIFMLTESKGRRRERRKEEASHRWRSSRNRKDGKDRMDHGIGPAYNK
jgi:hypothetical protein